MCADCAGFARQKAFFDALCVAERLHLHYINMAHDDMGTPTEAVFVLARREDLAPDDIELSSVDCGPRRHLIRGIVRISIKVI